MSESIDDFFKKKKATKKKKTVVSVDVLNRKIKETNQRQQQEDAEAAEAELDGLNENGRGNSEMTGVENEDPDWLAPTNDAIDSIEIEAKGIRFVSTDAQQPEEEVVEIPENTEDEDVQTEKGKQAKGWKFPTQGDVVSTEQPHPQHQEDINPSVLKGNYVPGQFSKIQGRAGNANKPEINDVEQFPTLGGATEIEDEQKRLEQEQHEQRKKAGEKAKVAAPAWGKGKQIDLMKDDLPGDTSKYQAQSNRSSGAYLPPGSRRNYASNQAHAPMGRTTGLPPAHAPAASLESNTYVPPHSRGI